ncbi:MAG: hypothetical protein DWI26_03495 [Planctomycetota bacterium]|nr:MAG: hypothetical protein DWI26_03495 [Planctomycetota bacterium]
MQLQLVHQLLSEKASWPACTLARRLAAVQPLQQKAAAMQLLHLVQLQLQHLVQHLVQHLQLVAAMQLQLAMLLQPVHLLLSEKAFWPACMHARSPAAVPLLQQLAAAMQLLLQPQPQLAAATNFSFMALCH